MTHRFVYLFSSLLAVVGASLVTLCATPAAPGPWNHDRLQEVRRANAEIVVDGVTQPQYAHAGRWYVEALKGREYAIHLRNPYPVRVAVALSVDGLNTIDARETTAQAARKWVIEPYGSITIGGWQTSRAEARRFEFTTEARSYGQALGKTANLGVITAAFFLERVSAIGGASEHDARRPAQPATGAGPAGQAGQAERAEMGNDAGARADEFAATGMGRRADHRVREVSLELEERPVQTTTIRYEFRPQLVRLGILPPERVADPLTRRESGRGFEPRFSPVPDGR